MGAMGTLLLTIAVPYPPFGVLISPELLDAARLLFLGDVQEELDDDVAVVRQGALECVDVFEAADSVRLRERPLNVTVDDDLVPPMIEHHHAAVGGQPPPETVQPRQGQLVGAGREHGVNLECPGLEPLGELLDDGALPRKAPSLEHHDNADAGFPAGALELEQTPLQWGHLLAVLVLGDGALRVDFLEHCRNRRPGFWRLR